MRILIDECLPKNIKKEFSGHVVKTVREMNWDSMTNGELMDAAIKNDFEVFVTVDNNLQFQQNLKKYNLIVIVLVVLKNELDLLKPIIPKVLENLNSLEKGKAYEFKQK
jgi:predicted nuclease of predicted toxin-antitoxin system